MIKKGIVLAGGKGTRVYPATKAASKQILPVYDKPTIYYPVSTLIKLGIKDICIICNPLDRNVFYRLFGQGEHLGVNFRYEIQDSPNGVAESLIIGEKFINGENIALILGDNIFSDIDNIFTLGGAGIVGCKVNNPQDYGVVDDATLNSNGNYTVKSIIEKPENPKTDIAVTGLYLYDGTATKRAKELTPSKRGQLEITDLNMSYSKDNSLELTMLEDEHAWFDTGDKDQMFEASMYVKSIQDRTNVIIGSPELESYKAGNISKDQFMNTIQKMPSCKYKQLLLKSIQPSYL